ncbi:MAG: hypothetical protein JKX98_00765 [Alcanivoracaceae bacterium]|nr:hypothetical protein [Alcanivoracaceae bacterium]
MKRLILTVIFLNFVVACATTKNDKQRFTRYDDYISSHNLTSLDKIRTFKFQNWKPLDNKHVILSSFRNKQYIITLANYCVDLEITSNIFLKQAMNSSLSTHFDAIIVSRHPLLECRIKTIHKLNKDQENEVLALH